MSIQIDELSETLGKELTIYHDDVIKKLKKLAQKDAQKLVKDTKATAPVGRRSKHYKDHIKCKKTFETGSKVEYTWYVDGADYRLSHLLEHGHALKDGGRVEGTGFIQKAAEPILEHYVKGCEEVCRGD